MPTYVLRDGKLVEKHLAPQRTESSAAPGVISDIMEPTKHMASGKLFTSKAAFRAETKAYGCIEVGNDASITRPRKPITLSREKRVDDIRRTIYELRNGR
jgi:hypothetical protein